MIDLFKIRLTLQNLTQGGRSLLCIVPQEQDLTPCVSWLNFLGYKGPVHLFPPWDVSPYDRASPDAVCTQVRILTLAQLASSSDVSVIVTTPSALMRKLPPRDVLVSARMVLEPSMMLRHEDLRTFLHRTGYVRVSTVYEPGDYTVRGSIVDVYPPGDGPLRLDFFGDTLESIRSFDPLTQRSEESHPSYTLWPAREVILTPHTIRQFRSVYRQEKGFKASQDPIYQSVSEGIYTPGLESYLPLFYETCHTLLDYVPESTQVLEAPFTDVILNQTWADLTQQVHIHQAVQDHDKSGRILIPPESFDLQPAEVMQTLRRYERILVPSDNHVVLNTSLNLSSWMQSLEAMRSSPSHAVIFCASSDQGVQRLHALAQAHDVHFQRCETLGEIEHPGYYVTDQAPIAQGFQTDSFWLVAEQDVFGPKQKPPTKMRQTPEALLLEFTSLKAGDHVVHHTHGIGRYKGLVTLTLQEAAHECCALVYEGDDKLFVPVEHVHLLSRYGGADAGVTLDRLGGTAWQARKAKVQKRLHMMTEQLIQLAAQRAAQQAIVCHPPVEDYEVFCGGFPYVETEDQQRAIQDVLDDMASGQPMDRVVCGDVGFGKTEVAMRATFAMAAQGHQVVIICPTTLLCRQHALNFQKRFQNTPFRIGHLSRMVSSQEARSTQEGWNEGRIHILVATHAVLNAALKFPGVGLIILDEEQHFGVGHKEKFKALQPQAHLLTLSATPIPRTFQMALSGLRTLSLIRTPPVDRTAVHTIIGPWELSTVIHALEREYHRGGQSFLVTPHIEDLEGLQKKIAQHRPSLRTTCAHGQMTARDLERAMITFADGQTDVLICTSIVESGLDIPKANTIILHKSDHFGLAQLYQLRGRVGRSDVQAYAHFTYDPDKTLTQDAQKRLNVMRTLDHLGASFMLAHHDMDIRGAGNLLGAEQSGHVRDVGIELYQTLLAEAVQSAQYGECSTWTQEWTPTLNVGLAILIPETYIPDLDMRLHMYRTINQECMRGQMSEARDMLMDRFGPVPSEVDHLLRLMDIQRRCIPLKIVKIDAGPRGAVLSFLNDAPPSVERLIPWVQKYHPVMKFRSDQRLVYSTSWPDGSARLKGLEKLVAHLETLFK